MDKATLKQYRAIKSELNHLGELIDELHKAACSPRTTKYSDEIRSKGKHSDLSTMAAKVLDLKAKYDAKFVEHCEAALEIEQAIDRLPPRERELMRRHYVQGQTWEKVAVEMDYSWRQVHNIHSIALNLLKSA